LAARVRGLNNALLRLQSRLRSAGPGGVAPIRAQGTGLIAQRRAALAALIEQDAGQALALGFSAGLASRLGKDFPQAAAQLESHGSWTGIYEAEVIDGESLASSREVRRLRTGNRLLAIHFTKEPAAALAGGATVRVSGMLAGDNIAATGAETVAAATGQTCSTFGEQRIAVIKVTFPTFASNPPSYPNATLHDYLFGAAGRTVSNYWRDASYGQTWASGDVYPAGSDAWYMLDREYSCASGNDESALLRQAAIDAADPDIDYNNYERVVIVFPKPASGCAYAGLGSIGCWLAAPDGSPAISYALQRMDQMTTRDSAVMLTTHEGGHNLGLRHGSSLDFGAQALGPLNEPGTRSEYGDKFTTMGTWNLGHYAAEHKKALGWLTSSQIATVNSSGSFSIEPMSGAPAGGRKALEVTRGTDNSQRVWIEYRQAVGDYDSQLIPQVYGGALLHYDNLQGGGRTQLLDFTTETSSFTDPALAGGQSWSDPYTNLSIGIAAATPSSLGVSVDFGTTPCTPADPSITLTPLNPSVPAGDPVSYSAVITNNDAAGCTASTFNLSSSAPPGWNTSFQPPTLTIAPGTSATASMTKTPVATPDPGTYAVDTTAAKAADPSSSATAQANVTVEALPPPVFTLTINASSGGTVTYSPPGSACRGTCTATYPRSPEQSVTLTASADNRKSFLGWSGACTGTATTCVVTVGSNLSVSASFGKAPGRGGGNGAGGKSNGKGQSG
jgi:M6 family metalloprotease-like protein